MAVVVGVGLSDVSKHDWVSSGAAPREIGSNDDSSARPRRKLSP
jgi:hypothetical protein